MRHYNGRHAPRASLSGLIQQLQIYRPLWIIFNRNNELVLLKLGTDLLYSSCDGLAVPAVRHEISLSLRSLADAAPNHSESAARIGDSNSGSVRMLKYGVPSRTFGIN